MPGAVCAAGRSLRRDCELRARRLRLVPGARLRELQLHGLSRADDPLRAVDAERRGRRADQPRGAVKSTLPMAEDAAEKLRQGRTNLEELIRALPHSAVRQMHLGAV